MEVAPDPLPAASAPTSVTTLIPATQAIAIQLPPKSLDDKYFGLEPAMWVPVVTIITLVVTSAIQIRNTNKQLDQARQTSRDELEQALSRARDGRIHAEDRARQDRIMDARRDIYVEIMTDYQKVQQFIGSMATAEAKFEERASLSVMSASVNKLWIWGEVESALRIREFYTRVNEFYYSALARALTIRHIRDNIKACGSLAADREEKVQEIEAQLQALRASAAYMQMAPYALERENALSRAQQEATKEAHQFLGDVSEYSRTLTYKEAQYLDFVIERQTELNAHINAVMSSARADIGIKGDTSMLDKQTEEMSKRVREAIASSRAEHQRDMESVFGSEYGE